MNNRCFGAILFFAISYMQFFQASQSSFSSQPSTQGAFDESYRESLLKSRIEEKRVILEERFFPLTVDTYVMSLESLLLNHKKTDKEIQHFLKLQVELLYVESKRITAQWNDSEINRYFGLQRSAVHKIYRCHNELDRAQEDDVDLEERINHEKSEAYIRAYHHGLKVRERCQELKVQNKILSEREARMLEATQRMASVLIATERMASALIANSEKK